VRRLWHCLEHLNAVTYFAEECREANRTAGLRGFWMGYFASRAAPLGPVGPGVVHALFFNFAPSMIQRSIPDAWRFAEPVTILELRQRSAASALRRIIPDVADVAESVLDDLAISVVTAPGSGRALFCVNRDVERPPDPVEALWQSATALREHRGDGHTALLTSKGLSGCEPHVLFASEGGIPREVLQSNRGWSDEEWVEAQRRLQERGLYNGATLTSAGHRLRADIEQATDELAGRAYDAIGPGGVKSLIDLLIEPARCISRSGDIPYPNPIGLPPIDLCPQEP